MSYYLQNGLIKIPDANSWTCYLQVAFSSQISPKQNPPEFRVMKYRKSQRVDIQIFANNPFHI